MGISKVARGARVVAGATLASRVLGLLRDIVLGNSFSNQATDAFFVAFTIPNLMRRLVGEGALTIAFVPIFTESLGESRERAREVFDATWTLGALAGLVILALGIPLALPLVELFAPGFAATPGKLELAAGLLRWCFPYIFFLVLVAVAMGTLNSVGHFLSPALAPVLLNLCLISAAFGFAGAFEPPVLALGFAVAIAGLLQALLQWPALARHGFRPRLRLAPGDPAIRNLGSLMLPAALGAAVYQINLLVTRFLSSFQGDGAVSYLYYASRMVELPLGIFVFAIGMASLPSFARLVQSGNQRAVVKTFGASLSLTLALALPSSVGLLLLREPIFDALFAWNAELFGPEAVRASAQALLYYSPGLAAIAVARMYTQICVANQNTKTPARAALVSLVVNLVAALALTAPLAAELLPGEWFGRGFAALHRALSLTDLGYAGLAAATTIAAFVNAGFLMARARSLYGGLLDAATWRAFGTSALASAGMAIAVLVLHRILPADGLAKPARVSLLALDVVIGVMVYAGLLYLFRSRDLRAVAAGMRRS